MSAQYPLFKVHVGNIDRLMASLRVVLESGFLNEGTQVAELTQGFEKTLDAENVCMVNSCTSALTLALKASGVKENTTVISTSMTCLATNCPIVTLGADIAWADIDPNTGCIDVADVKRLLDARDNVKAVMAVAWAGIPPMLKDLRDLCKQRGVKLILDAAHAMGATFRLKPIHYWADFTCYSLQAIKHVTTGDGGILISSDPNNHARVKNLKWFGIDRNAAKDESGNWRGQHWDFDVKEAGFKFNMNNLSAAIGLEQLHHVHGVVNTHRRNARLYTDIFEGSTVIRPLRASFGSTHWVYTVRVKQPELRDPLLKKLNEEGIMAGVVHVPNHYYQCFEHFRGVLPGVEEFARSQFSLPVGWWMTEDDVRHVAQRVEEIIKELQ